jgi:hypothetical protein
MFRLTHPDFPGKSVHILGVVHVNTYENLLEECRNVIEEGDYLFTEVHFDDSDDLLEIYPITSSRISLKERLSKEKYDFFEQKVDMKKYEFVTFESLLQQYLLSCIMKSLKGPPSDKEFTNSEKVAWNKFDSDHKSELEEVNEQIQSFFPILRSVYNCQNITTEDQIQMEIDKINKIDTSMRDQLVLIQKSKDFEEISIPSMVKNNIDTRNIPMCSKINLHFKEKSSKRIVVLLGVFHVISSDSIIKLFNDMGYQSIKYFDKCYS